MSRFALLRKTTLATLAICGAVTVVAMPVDAQSLKERLKKKLSGGASCAVTEKCAPKGQQSQPSPDTAAATVVSPEQAVAGETVSIASTSPLLRTLELPAFEGIPILGGDLNSNAYTSKPRWAAAPDIEAYWYLLEVAALKESGRTDGAVYRRAVMAAATQEGLSSMFCPQQTPGRWFCASADVFSGTGISPSLGGPSANEFELQAAEKAFLSAVSAIEKMATAAPKTIFAKELVMLRDYDFEAKGFPFRPAQFAYVSSAPGRGGSGGAIVMAPSLLDPACRRQHRPSTCPQAPHHELAVDEATARSLSQELGRERYVTEVSRLRVGGFAEGKVFVLELRFADPRSRLFKGRGTTELLGEVTRVLDSEGRFVGFPQ